MAAIAAREKGASVLIVEKNFDIGGRCMMSFGGLYIGGGNRLQKAIGKDHVPGEVACSVRVVAMGSPLPSYTHESLRDGSAAIATRSGRPGS